MQIAIHASCKKNSADKNQMHEGKRKPTILYARATNKGLATERDLIIWPRMRAVRPTLD